MRNAGAIPRAGLSSHDDLPLLLGAKIWIRADRETRVIADFGGLVAADIAGRRNGRGSAGAYVGAGTPTLGATSGAKSKPAIVFDGSSAMNLDYDFSIDYFSRGLTVAVVVEAASFLTDVGVVSKWASAAASAIWAIQGSAGAAVNSGASLVSELTTNINRFSIRNWSGVNDSESDTSSSVPRVLMLHWDPVSGLVTHYTSRTSGASTPCSAAKMGQVGTGIKLGHLYTGANKLTGKIPEVMAFPYPMSAPHRVELWDYMTERYGTP